MNLKQILCFTLLLFFPILLFSQTCCITFQVYPPEKVSKDYKIFIVGNRPELGNWNPGKVALSKNQNGFFEIAIDFTQNTKIEYKITRGSWDKEAIYEDGIVPENSKLHIFKDQNITIHVKNWRDMVFIDSGGITGEIKYHKKFESSKLEKTRDVAVLLPKSYNKNQSKHYPVLYMHDGQNCFNPSTSFTGIDWQVDEVIDSLSRQGKMQEILAVFINNTDNRMKEYSDLSEGKAYIDFVVHELKPFIDQNYRTLPERENTAIMGSSLGGLVSFLFPLYYPEIVGKAGCLSISLWNNINNRYAELLSKLKTKDFQLYFDSGNELQRLNYKTKFYELKKLVLSQGFYEGKNVLFRTYPNHDHNEKSWAKRIHVPLFFFFGVEKE